MDSWSSIITWMNDVNRIKMNTDTELHVDIVHPTLAKTTLLTQGKKEPTYGSNYTLQWSTPHELLNHIEDLYDIFQKGEKNHC